MYVCLCTHIGMHAFLSVWHLHAHECCVCVYACMHIRVCMYWCVHIGYRRIGIEGLWGHNIYTYPAV